MNKLGLTAARPAEAKVHSPGLKITAVRAARDFAIGLLRRQPNLDVIGLSGAKAHIPCGQHNRTVREAEKLKNSLGISGELFVFALGLFGKAEFYKLYLFELMLTD